LEYDKQEQGGKILEDDNVCQTNCCCCCCCWDFNYCLVIASIDRLLVITTSLELTEELLCIAKLRDRSLLDTLLARSVLDKDISLSTLACLVVASFVSIALLSANNNIITTDALAVLVLLGIPAVHAAAALASQSTNFTLLCLAKLSAEAGLINTSVVSTSGRVGDRAVRKITIAHTVNLVLVAERTVVSAVTDNTSAVIEDIAVDAGCANITRTLVTALETEFLLADVLGASVLIISNNMSTRAAICGDLSSKKAVLTRLKSHLCCTIGNNTSLLVIINDKVVSHEECRRSGIAQVDEAKRVPVEVQVLEVGKDIEEIVRKSSDIVIVEIKISELGGAGKQIRRKRRQTVVAHCQDLKILEVDECVISKR